MRSTASVMAIARSLLREARAHERDGHRLTRSECHQLA